MYNGPNAYNYPNYGAYMAAVNQQQRYDQQLYNQMQAIRPRQHHTPEPAPTSTEADVYVLCGSRAAHAVAGAALGAVMVAAPLSALVLANSRSNAAILGFAVPTALGALGGASAAASSSICLYHTSCGLGTAAVLAVLGVLGGSVSAALAFWGASFHEVSDGPYPYERHTEEASPGAIVGVWLGTLAGLAAVQAATLWGFRRLIAR